MAQQLKEIRLEPHDDDLSKFEAEGAAPLPATTDQGYVENEGARIWYASYGTGAPVILLHGGLGNSGNWVSSSCVGQSWLSGHIDG